MHHILCFIAGIAQCHRTRRTMAPSSRRVSSPRPLRHVFFGPPCTFYLVLYVLRNLHFCFNIALNRTETLVIKPVTFGYAFGIATHCIANRLGPLRYLSVDFISLWTSLLDLAVSLTCSRDQFKPPAIRSLSISN